MPVRPCALRNTGKGNLVRSGACSARIPWHGLCSVCMQSLQTSRVAKVIVRGGRLLDPAARSAEPADLLIVDGVIAAIGPPGLPAPADALPFDASHTLLHAGLVNGHTHGSTNFSKATHDRWTLELLLSGSGEWAHGQTLEQKYLNT